MTRKVLDGGRTEILPIERPTHFRLVINLKSARVLKLQLSQALLARPDDVIE
jgi:ABC-type uncharacterized transport system substrate-binding protein